MVQRDPTKLQWQVVMLLRVFALLFAIGGVVFLILGLAGGAVVPFAVAASCILSAILILAVGEIVRLLDEISTKISKLPTGQAAEKLWRETRMVADYVRERQRRERLADAKELETASDEA